MLLVSHAYIASEVSAQTLQDCLFSHFLSLSFSQSVLCFILLGGKSFLILSSTYQWFSFMDCPFNIPRKSLPKPRDEDCSFLELCNLGFIFKSTATFGSMLPYGEVWTEVHFVTCVYPIIMVLFTEENVIRYFCAFVKN
jgi:hypothetical protein